MTAEFIPRNSGVLLIGICMIESLALFCNRWNNERDHIVMDRLDRAERYYDRHPAFEKAFTFLRQDSLAQWAPGRYEIDGDKMFCLISDGPGRKREQARLEAHRKYIDIQYIIAGADEMGWKPATKCKIPDVEYDAEKDIEFFKDPPRRWTVVPAGSFAIFFPADAHAPLVSDGAIHKVVLKIAVE